MRLNQIPHLVHFGRLFLLLGLSQFRGLEVVGGLDGRTEFGTCTPLRKANSPSDKDNKRSSQNRHAERLASGHLDVLSAADRPDRCQFEYLTAPCPNRRWPNVIVVAGAEAPPDHNTQKEENTEKNLLLYLRDEDGGEDDKQREDERE